GMELPLRVIGHVLGISRADLPAFKQWSLDLMAVSALSGEPRARIRAAIDAVRNMTELMTGLIRERRGHDTGDLLSTLVNDEEGGESLSDEELVAISALIVAAGHETTANVIGNGGIALPTHPDQLAKLQADPGLITPAVEETMRYDSQSGWMGRITTAETTVGEHTFPAGTLVFAVPGSANRDERAFADPDRFDI